MRRLFGKGSAQAVRRNPGEIEEALRPPLVLENPAKEGQRQSRGITLSRILPVDNCQTLLDTLRAGSSFLGGGTVKGAPWRSEFSLSRTTI